MIRVLCTLRLPLSVIVVLFVVSTLPILTIVLAIALTLAFCFPFVISLATPPLRVSIIVLRAIVSIVVVAAATTMKAMTTVIALHTEGYLESCFSLAPIPTD